MIHSFLLIGQSNMAGRGFINEAPEIDNTHIKILRNGMWQPMFRPVNPDRSFSGVSLAESFALKYAEKYNVDVGLICCADGGTSLEQWQPGGLLFKNAVFNMKLAAETSVISGVLWHQGEADCEDGLYKTYEKRFTYMMEKLRKELPEPEIPFILGGLGDFLKYCSFSDELKNYIYVNDALKSVSQNNPMTGFVSAEGLSANPDNLHFNSKSLYEFGVRYFEEFEKIEKKLKSSVEKKFETYAQRSAMSML